MREIQRLVSSLKMICWLRLKGHCKRFDFLAVIFRCQRGCHFRESTWMRWDYKMVNHSNQTLGKTCRASLKVVTREATWLSNGLKEFSLEITFGVQMSGCCSVLNTALPMEGTWVITSGSLTSPFLIEFWRRHWSSHLVHVDCLSTRWLFWLLWAILGRIWVSRVHFYFFSIICGTFNSPLFSAIKKRINLLRENAVFRSSEHS